LKGRGKLEREEGEKERKTADDDKTIDSQHAQPSLHTKWNKKLLLHIPYVPLIPFLLEGNRPYLSQFLPLELSLDLPLDLPLVLPLVLHLSVPLPLPQPQLSVAAPPPRQRLSAWWFRRDEPSSALFPEVTLSLAVPTAERGAERGEGW
jgi:hypothetical protein